MMLSLKSLFSAAMLAVHGAPALDPDVALTCNPDRDTKVPEITVRLAADGTLAWEQHADYRKEALKITYALKGQSEIQDKYGAFVGIPKVAVFTGRDDQGYTYVDLGLTPNADGVIKGESRNSWGGGELDCTRGPAAPALDALMAQAPALTQEEYSNLQDGQLAATCRKAGETADSFSIRAMRYGFGSVDLQVRQRGKERGIDLNFDTMEFGKSGVLVFKTGKELAISYDGQRMARAYFELEPAASGYRLVVIPNLREPGQGLLELTCTERQAFETLGKFVADAREMPKALPSPVGTLSQIDRSLCSDDRYEVAQQRVSKWSRLLMDLELADGMVTGLSMGRDKADHCPSFKISVSTRKGADELRRLLGESLDGMKVEFDIGEESENRGGITL